MAVAKDGPLLILLAAMISLDDDSATLPDSHYGTVDRFSVTYSKEEY
jgi:hypothetical protein